MSTKLLLASSLPGERELLAGIIADMANQSLKRHYAKWLVEHGDQRGVFLNEVLDAWQSDSPQIPVDDSLSMVWQRTSGVTLLQHLRAGRMDSLPALFGAVRPALMLNPSLSPSELPIASSKYGGWPDLLENQAWPEVDGSLYAFVGQINLADIAQTQLASLLPATGLLSFFAFCDYESGGMPVGKVLLTSDTSKLERRKTDQPFNEGNEIAPECQLEFEETIDMPYVSLYDLDQSYADQMIGCRRAKSLGLNADYADAYEDLRQSLMPEREGRSHLLGWSHPQVAGDDLFDEDSRNLLTVASEEICQWCWGDGHQLFYGISNTALQEQQFDRITVVDG